MSETVLVTGASSGIGLELAKLFAQAGSNLILVARSEEKLKNLRVELVNRHSVHVEVIVSDLAKPNAAQDLVAEINERKLVVDVVVNNAGFGELGRFQEIAVQRQIDMIQLNVTTLVQLTWLLLPEMLKRKRGGVLNVASTAAFQPGPNMAVYYASKSFVLSFSEALHEELVDTGLHVTALCPGPTETGFAKESGMDKSRLFDAEAMNATKVAEIGYDAFRKNQAVVVSGWKNRFVAVLVRFVPRAMVRKMVKRLQQVE